jgi:hypothetical protein
MRPAAGSSATGVALGGNSKRTRADRVTAPAKEVVGRARARERESAR